MKPPQEPKLPPAPPPVPIHDDEPKIPLNRNVIATFGSDQNLNGYLIPLWSSLYRPDLRPDQVYATVIAPGARKGPHLHMKRRGVFYCIEGSVMVRYKPIPGTEQYYTAVLQPGSDPVVIPPGWAAALYNMSYHGFAFVINMPSPAWDPDDRDEHKVEDWKDHD